MGERNKTNISPLLQLQFNMDDCGIGADIEVNHCDADDILVETIRYLESRCNLTDTEIALINNILTAFDTMGQWYA